MNPQRIWAAIVFIAGYFELKGIRSKNKNDTLSEYTWSKTKTPAMRGAVVGLVGWLVYHFSFGNGTPLGSWDIIFASGGAILGIISTFTRRK